MNVSKDVEKRNLICIFGGIITSTIWTFFEKLKIKFTI
jgi:hypothetical protein